MKLFSRIMTGLLVVMFLLAAADLSYAKVIKEDRNLKGFDRIAFSISGDLNIVQGDNESVVIETDEDVLKHIETIVKGGTLYIRFEKGLNFWKKFKHFRGPINIYVEMKDLSGLDISGSGDVEAAGIKTDKLDASISGSGNITVEGLTAQSLDFSISGSGNITIKDMDTKQMDMTIAGSGSARMEGKADHQDIQVSGSGNYNGSKLKGTIVDVSVGGSGSSKVYAVDQLNVSISGSGSVRYNGDPRISKSISGSGSVHKM